MHFGSPGQSPQPGGSPHAAAAVAPAVALPPGDIGMNDLARIVAEAAAAAARAAEAATAVSTQQQPEKKKDLYRLIPKPPVFNPSDREQEVIQWKDWYWTLKQYLVVVDAAYEKDLDELEEKPSSDVDWDLLTDDEQARGRFLYSLLGTLLQGRLLSVVRNIDHSNGLEAMRQLLENCQPKARNRTMSMLQSIMAYPPFSMKSSILPQVLKLEEHFNQFERLGGKMTEEMKSAVLLKCVGGSLKVHLNLSLNEGSNYAEIRKTIMAYDTATTRWNESAALQQHLQSGDSAGVTPMEIDRLRGELDRLQGKAKGKDGKSKGKGKEGKSKGKGKDGSQKGKGKGSGKDSNQWGGNQWKGSQKGGSQAGGEKGKGKGKNKSNNSNGEQLCFNCGRPGHVARDCWRVRQVSNPDPSTTIVTSVVEQAESIGPSASQACAASPTTTTKTVRRVSQPSSSDGQNSTVVFDLREPNDSTVMHIRMVQFYYIDVDEKKMEEQGEDVELYNQINNEVSIIIDSGADAPVFPASMLACGEPHDGEVMALQDAQGRSIPTLGQRTVSIQMEDFNGCLVELRDNVVFSEEITQPILSYGRLMDAGWSINAERRSLCNGPYEIPVEKQNQSIVMKGVVRSISSTTTTGVVRAMEAKLSTGLNGFVEEAFGWSKEGSRWVGVHLSSSYQNPIYVANLDPNIEWMRTTLIRQNDKWLMVEYCEKVSEMMDADLPITETATRTTVVTFLTDGFEDVELMGFEVEGWPEEGQHQRNLEDQIDPLLNIPEDERLEVAEIEMLQGGEAARGEAVPEEAPQEAVIVVGDLLPTQIEVNGVVLTGQSSLASLRIACGFYEISKSGSKAKCFRRLADHQRKLELLAAQQAFAQEKAALERHPEGQRLVRPPSPEEVEKHELTHLPYQPWCEACIKHKARPDKHVRHGRSHETGVPVISLDFCVTRVKDGLAQDQPPDELGDDKGALWLVMTCNRTGYLGVVPVKAKNQLSYLTHEVLSFVQALGWEEVGFYGDNEPIIRQMLKTIITARHALGLRTKVYTTKVRDSAGNALAENSIQRVRQLACVFMQDVTQRTGMSFKCDHALWSWAGRHAAWCLNRFQPTKGITAYEAAHGKTFKGKVCRFGEPVYAYCKTKGKADPKWRLALFLGKTESQDAWIVGEGMDVMLTRSIRRVDKDWSTLLAYYAGLQTHSYIYQTNFGGRIVPTKRAIGARAGVPKLSDEEATAVMKYAMSRQGRLETQEELKDALDELPAVLPPRAHVEVQAAPVAAPEPMFMAPLTPPLEGQLVQQPVEPAAMPSTPVNPSNADVLAQPSSPRASQARPSAEPPGEIQAEEPAAKRSKPEPAHVKRVKMIERRLVETQVGSDKFYHLDESLGEHDLQAWEAEDANTEEFKVKATDEMLWSDDPLSRPPPEPLAEVDRKADSLEIQRLMDMGVLSKLDPGDEQLETLTTKFVYDWRIKEFRMPPEEGQAEGKLVKRWMRRSRLVAREYATDKRDDVHSPASGGQSLRLLPIIYMMMRNVEGFNQEELAIGALDIKDAFLMVEQEKKVQVTTHFGRYRINRNLPGQRLGAKAWFLHLTKFLKEKGFTFCDENPCLARRDSSIFVLVHVDDIQMCGVKAEVMKFVKELESAFKISYTIAEKDVSSFEFLKRCYVVKEDGIDVIPGKYAKTMIENFEKRYGPAKKQKVPCGDEAQEIGANGLLPQDEAALYRSLVGCGIYLAAERVEISYAIKQLAGGMSSPTYSHLQVMRKLIGYLRETEGNYTHLEMPSYGKGVHFNYNSKWVLESFTDADWSGNKATRRSTSGAIHFVNGVPCFHSSRGQKVVSLSSSESELHGLVSGACDGILIRRSLEFLIQDEVLHICLMDNSATRQIAHKKGSSRLRHVHGKLLWIQDKVSEGELQVHQVGTDLNVSDLGTKPLAKQRLCALLFWCGVRNADGQPVGEDEAQQLKDKQNNKGKIMRMAKMLQAFMLFSGLEQAAGERLPAEEALHGEGALQRGGDYTELKLWISVLVAIIAVILAGFYSLYLENKKLRERIEKCEAFRGDIDKVAEHLVKHKRELAVKTAGKEMEDSMVHDHLMGLHIGLIRLGGYLKPGEDITEDDWEHWRYVEGCNEDEEVVECRRILRKIHKNRRRIRTHNERYGTPGPSDDEDIDYDELAREEAEIARLEGVSDAMWQGPRFENEEEETEVHEPEAEMSAEAANSPSVIDVEEPDSPDTVDEMMLERDYVEHPRIDWKVSRNRAQLRAHQCLTSLNLREIEEDPDNDRKIEAIRYLRRKHIKWKRCGDLADLVLDE